MSKDVFVVDKKYMDILQHSNINITEVLKKADLPEGIFLHKSSKMNTKEYIRFMEAIKEIAQDKELPLKISTVEDLETFSPPVFAAYCSKNGLMCLKRLSEYKKLMGSLVFNVTEKNNNVILEMTFEREEFEFPEYLVASELVFTLQIIRNATKKHIIPKEIITRYSLETDGYEKYFGVRPKTGNRNTMTISIEDALIPFVSWNDNMWDYFKPEFKRRLHELNKEDSYSLRVKTALTELLPGGQAGIDEVSKKLGYSRRTLQRKLSEEGTSFQKELNSTREELAKKYIKNFDMTNEEIAYLIGYNDCSSFFRAFNLWTGVTVSQYKKEMSSNLL